MKTQIEICKENPFVRICLPCRKDFFVENFVSASPRNSPRQNESKEITLTSLKRNESGLVSFPTIDSDFVSISSDNIRISLAASQTPYLITWTTKKKSQVVFYGNSQLLGPDYYELIDDEGNYASFFGKSGNFTVSELSSFCLKLSRKTTISLVISFATEPFRNLTPPANYQCTSSGLSSRLYPLFSENENEMEEIYDRLRKTSLILPLPSNNDIRVYYPKTEINVSVDYEVIYWTSTYSTRITPFEIADYSNTSKSFRGYRIDNSNRRISFRIVLYQENFLETPRQIAICAMWKGKGWFHTHTNGVYILTLSKSTSSLEGTFFLPFSAATCSLRVNAYDGKQHTNFVVKDVTIPAISFERVAIL